METVGKNILHNVTILCYTVNKKRLYQKLHIFSKQESSKNVITVHSEPAGLLQIQKVRILEDVHLKTSRRNGHWQHIL